MHHSKKAEIVTQPSHFQRLGISSAGFRISPAEGSRGRKRETNRREGRALGTYGTSSPRIPRGLQIPETRSGNLYPNPQSADHGRHHVRKPGRDAAALPPPLPRSLPGEGFLENCSHHSPRVLRGPAPTKDLPSGFDGVVSAPLALSPFPSPSVGMVRPGTEAPGVGSVVAPSAPLSLPPSPGMWASGAREVGGAQAGRRAGSSAR